MYVYNIHQLLNPEMIEKKKLKKKQITKNI